MPRLAEECSLSGQPPVCGDRSHGCTNRLQVPAVRECFPVRAGMDSSTSPDLRVRQGQPDADGGLRDLDSRCSSALEEAHQFPQRGSEPPNPADSSFLLLSSVPKGHFRRDETKHAVRPQPASLPGPACSALLALEHRKHFFPSRQLAFHPAGVTCC